MAEDHTRSGQFAYKSNANLVLEADRGSRRRPNEATGEVESLVGNISYRMGDKVSQSKPAELEEKLQKLKEKRSRKQDDSSSRKRQKTNNVFVAASGSTVLTESTELDAFTYKPKTAESRTAYDQILSIVNTQLGSQPSEILAGAAEEVVSIIKSDAYRDPEKHDQVKLILNNLSATSFNRIVQLSKHLVDFSLETSTETESKAQDEDVDTEMGVAVVFDEEDEAESDNIDEIDDDESESDDEINGVETNASSRLKGDDNQTGDVKEKGKYYLSATSIDAFWLQRQVSKYYTDADISATLATKIMTILIDNPTLGQCENELVNLLDYDKFELIKLLVENRTKVMYCTRLNQAQSDKEREDIEQEMMQKASDVLKELKQTSSAESWMQDRIGALETISRNEARELLKQQDMATDDRPVESNLHYVDVESLSFAKGGHYMSNKECKLPEGTWRRQQKGYEEVHVPAVRTVSNAREKLVSIPSLPEWTHDAFKGMKSLNRVQSKMYPAAFETAENLLLCAPTGAGKTNVAVLTILHEINKARNPVDGSIDYGSFKIVYIAPMKALVQEVVANFTQRLTNAYGIQVRELSGDQNLSREQIQTTQIIVTTPEKWDIITRKSGDRTYTQLVRLVIIDEIHLLHDDRGPVLESIVARTIRQIESTQEMVRLVGLSATLPNYQDVAYFLRVDPSKGLFYFDSSYRPVPLQQQYIGIMEKKAMKRFQLMNAICYEKVLEQAGKNQVLIFVHSRKETAATARSLRETCLQRDELSHFIKEGSASSEILQTEAENVKTNDLKEVLPYGFAIHHAGMPRSDRNLVEELFADGHIQVLCSTATLAWGVNLPAHTVIIKGTQRYNADKGAFTELSPLDILQMLGRAGRVQYDTQGEGIIITQHSELKFYLSLMNQQLPVESQLMNKLADSLNAEIVLGTIQTIKQAAEWIGYTYFYVRLLRSPSTYGVRPEMLKEDASLMQYRMDLAHSAATLLAKNQLIQYDRRAGTLQVTAMGRVASHYYVVHQSMAVYNEYLKPNMSEIELFRVFSLSHEFRNVVVRAEEKLEVAKLIERVPIPVKESMEEPSAKVNVLLQAYISHLNLNGFALLADMVHISQSGSRILRALFEIALTRQWADLSLKLLSLCQMVDQRIWSSQSPLRQIPGLPPQVLRKIERKDIPFARYLDLSVGDLGQLINDSKLAKQLHQSIRYFPRLEVACHIQPITRSLLKVECTLTPDFQFNPEIHQNAVGFWILVTDVDGEKILYREWFMLKAKYANEEQIVTFTLPLYDPVPPVYFLRVVSDRWLHAETILPISFQQLLLPAKQPMHTELLDLQPLSIQALKHSKLQSLYDFSHFNPIQTQAFSKLYQSDENILLAAPTGSGKTTVCAELALARGLIHQREDLKCIYLVPRQELADIQLNRWRKRFEPLFSCTISVLTGELSSDLTKLRESNIIISTPDPFDALSRRWRQRKALHEIQLVIMDELHLLGTGEVGCIYETIGSRLRYMSAQLEKQQSIRFVGLSGAISNAFDLGEWIGASSSDGIFSFHPSVRPVPLDIHIQTFEINHFSSLMLAMSKPAYHSIRQYDQPTLIFVPSRKQAELTAIDLMTFSNANDEPNHFKTGNDNLESDECSTLHAGIGYYYEGISKDVVNLFQSGKIQVLIVPHTLAYAVDDLSAELVVLLGTKSYDGKEHRFMDYPMVDIQQMIGRSRGKCVVFTHTTRKTVLTKCLTEPIPIESHFDHFLSDQLNAEIVTKTIESKQDAVDYLTWTFLYRRIRQNPNYYNVYGTSHQHLSDYLSELVESTITNLQESKCITVEEDDMTVSGLNLGMISAYYRIQYTTIELFACSLSGKTKLKGILEIISNATEFSTLPIRHGEEQLLVQMAKHVKYSMPASTVRYNDPHIKVNVLLQYHFSRKTLPTEPLKQDLKNILSKVVILCHAMVDVISSNGWLKPALLVMDFCQMIVQGLWVSDSCLSQIPFFTSEIVKACEEQEIETPLDILSVEDDVREKLLPFPSNQLSTIAAFCNGFPDINVDFSVNPQEETVDIVVTREEPAPKVLAPFYPLEKTEQYWIVIGSKETNTLVSIKRITLSLESKVKLSLDDSQDKFQLFVICDSYLGCDLENDLN